MSEIAKFFSEVDRNVQGLKADRDLHALSRVWAREVGRHRYAYNFTWLGRPVIQVPQDLVAMQEILWRVKPELVIETGVAHGGSLLFYASMLELAGVDGRVIGVDIDVRPHNREAIEAHPMSRRVDLLVGSSIDPEIVAEVRARARGKGPIVVVLDSNHTHEHVLAELRAYAPLVTKDSYLVVFDTLIEDLPEGYFTDRPWGKGNNPKTAVNEYLREAPRFEVDEDMDAKLLISVAPGGYLRCTGDAP
jgi:cephalosporin hydroxylase